MTIDKDKLRALAEAARDYSGDELTVHEGHLDALAYAADPDTILALLGEIEHLTQSRQEARDQRNKLGDLFDAVEAERDQLKAENESLKGSCKAMGKDMAKVTRERNSARSKAEKLKAENEALRQSKERAIALVDQLEIQHAELKEAVKGLELDAERYRAIRDDIPHADLGRAILEVQSASEYDCAVDVAMAKEVSHG